MTKNKKLELEFQNKLNPFINYVNDMIMANYHDYKELFKKEYDTTKKTLDIFTSGKYAFIPNTSESKKAYLWGMANTTKKDIKNLVMNHDSNDYEILNLFYELHVQLKSTEKLLSEL